MDLVLLIYTFFFSLSKAIRSSQIRRNSLMTINIELLPYLRYSHSVCVCVCTPIERSQKSRKFFYRMPFFLSQLFAVTLEKKNKKSLAVWEFSVENIWIERIQKLLHKPQSEKVINIQ